MGGNNFLVRSNALFVELGLQTLLADAPSDRQTPPYLSGFRQTGKHLADIQAIIAWSRKQSGLPVWLVGTSRGAQSPAFVTTAATDQTGPDGLVLSSIILTDSQERPVPNMPRLMDKLRVPKQQLLSFTGGESRGEPCKTAAYHGYNGIEREVVQLIAAWMLDP